MDEKSLQKVKELREKKLTIKQIAKEVGISKTSVERAVAKLKQLEKNKQVTDQVETIKKLVHEELEQAKNSETPGGDSLPVVRKVGAGVEIITPEAILLRYTDGSLEDKMELRGMMKLRGAMLMVLDLVNIVKAEAEADAIRLEPILKLMRETREEQDTAAQRAKASVGEIAHQAAEEVAGRVVDYLSQKKPDIATVPNPFAGMMARAMEPMLMQLMGQVGKTLGGMSLPGTATQPGQPAGQGVGFQQMTDEERKSVFGG